jgi:hypothetical protein
MSERRAVDPDQLEEYHKGAHLSTMTREERLRECAWCSLLQEVREYRAAGPAITARARTVDVAYGTGDRMRRGR